MSDGLPTGQVAYPGAGVAGARVVAGGWDLDDDATVPGPSLGPSTPGDGPAVPEGE